MEGPSTADIIYKLAVAGEQAGLTVEQSIGLLIAVFGVDVVCQLPESRLGGAEPTSPRCSRWIM